MADKDASLGSTPPQAPDIERAVLGAMLFEREAIGTAIEVIGQTDDCFYKPAHALIYRAITDLYDQNLPVDQLTVTERLRQRGVLEQIGGEPAVAALAGRDHRRGQRCLPLPYSQGKSLPSPAHRSHRIGAGALPRRFRRTRPHPFHTRGEPSQAFRDALDERICRPFRHRVRRP